MKSYILTIVSAFLIFSGVFGQDNSRKPKIYLQNARGKRIDSAHYDAYGNFKFTVKKSGIYTLSRSENLNLIWSKKAFLSAGVNFLQVPQIENGMSNNRMAKVIKSRRRLAGAADGIHMKKVSRAPEISSDEDMMASPVKELEIMTDALPSVSEPKIKAPSKSSTTAKAGTLTAGIWTDLDNWDQFEKTIETEMSSMGGWTWNLIKNRYSVELSDKNGKPAIDVNVQIRNSKGEIIWSSKTDNRGFAELWYDPFNEKSVSNTVELFVQWGEQAWRNLGKIKPDGNNKSSFRLSQEIIQPKKVDIAFVVDATGSMGDEIEYLKVELMDLMLKSSQFAPCSEISLASVFYKDQGDEYVTIHSPFTQRFEDAVNFIQDQSAGGGGDFPEAVDDGLKESIQKLEWSKKALSRICFLVLDAPPHFEKKHEIENLVKQYSEKGIKIIPIVASGIDKPTEFLMKQMASITQGDYIYITDHSGVGNSHLKPSGVKENVDLLINQMEKIIRKYTQNADCKENPEEYNPDPQTIIFGDQQILLQFFPNPAKSFINIKSNVKIIDVEIFGLNGQLVKKFESLQTMDCRLDIRDLTRGMYILNVNAGGQSFKSKVLILDSPKED